MYFRLNVLLMMVFVNYSKQMSRFFKIIFAVIIIVIFVIYFLNLDAQKLIELTK